MDLFEHHGTHAPPHVGGENVLHQVVDAIAMHEFKLLAARVPTYPRPHRLS